MSGIKCGQISLEDRVRDAITTAFSRSAAATPALGMASALEAELEEIVGEARRLLLTGVSEPRHQALLEAFLERADQLTRAVADLRQRQRALESARNTAPALTQETLDAVSRLAGECDAAVRVVTAHASALREQLDDVEKALRQEQRGEIYRTALSGRQLRGLIADIDSRMDSALEGGLRAVNDQAAALRRRIAARADTGHADEAAVTDFRRQLDELIATSQSLERNALEQRVVHHRLMQTFKDAQYDMVPGSELVPDDYRSAARSTQQAEAGTVTAQTEVHPGGELRLTMLGPGESGVYCALPGCEQEDSHLRRLLEAARKHDIRIVNVAPVPGGGGVEEEAVQVKPREKEQHV